MLGKMGKIRPSIAIRTPGLATEVDTAHPVLRKGRKNVNIHANSRVIRGTPAISFLAVDLLVAEDR